MTFLGKGPRSRGREVSHLLMLGMSLNESKMCKSAQSSLHPGKGLW